MKGSLSLLLMLACCAPPQQSRDVPEVNEVLAVIESKDIIPDEDFVFVNDFHTLTKQWLKELRNDPGLCTHSCLRENFNASLLSEYQRLLHNFF